MVENPNQLKLFGYINNKTRLYLRRVLLRQLFRQIPLYDITEYKKVTMCT